MPVYPRWRVRFDPPHMACLRPGFARASLMGNIRRDIKIIATSAGRATWQDPLTGVVMLRPNFFDDRFPEAFTALSSWVSQAGFWRESKRAMDTLAGGGSTVTPSLLSVARPSDAGGPQPLLGIILSTTIAAIALAGLYQDDTLIPALESTFTHPEDAGFVMHARIHTDPARRYKNWFGVQWGHYFLHISLQGRVGLYHYVGGNLATTPVLVEETELFDPGDVAAKDHYFFVLPIPGFGYCVYHSLSATRQVANLSSADASAMRGHLFKVPSNTATGGSGDYQYLTPASKVRIYLNKSPRVSHDVGFAPILYPDSGAFAGELFDIGVRMDSAPDVVNAQALPSRSGISSSVAVQLLNNNLTPWTVGSGAAPGSGRQGRVGVTLTRFDAYHTPFIYSTYVAWAPIRALRNPGIVEMDNTAMLSFSQEDTGRWEGKAVVRAWSDSAKRLIERGDAYHIVERQDEEGGAWSVEFGGIARVEKDAAAHIINGQFEYQATWSLSDMTARLKEASCLWQTSFDGLSLKGATNTVLQSVGETSLVSAPARFDTLTIPVSSDGSNWQNGPNVGDDGNEVGRKFLALARKKDTEARLLHSWGSVSTGTGGQWSIDDKPRSTTAGNTWSLTDKVTEEDLPNRRVGIRRSDEDASQLFSFSPVPPAATTLQAYGVEGSQPSKANKIPGLPIENYNALRTATSLEYLGRVVTAYPMVSGTSDTAVLDRIARAVYDLSCRWKANLTVELTRYVSGLSPAKRIEAIRYEVYDTGTNSWVMRELQWRDNPATESTRRHLWVRRRRIVQTHCEIPARVYLDLSTQWESGIDE